MISIAFLLLGWRAVYIEDFKTQPKSKNGKDLRDIRYCCPWSDELASIMCPLSLCHSKLFCSHSIALNKENPYTIRDGCVFDCCYCISVTDTLLRLNDSQFSDMRFALVVLFRGALIIWRVMLCPLLSR